MAFGNGILLKYSSTDFCVLALNLAFFEILVLIFVKSGDESYLNKLHLKQAINCL